jgi:hypothetical protein
MNTKQSLDLTRATESAHAPLSRRTLLVSMVAAPALAAVVAACGDPTAEPAGSSPTAPGVSVPSTDPPASDGATDPPATDAPIIDHPTGADDVVIRLGYEGGFVPMGTAFVNLPTLLVSGDGKVYTQGAMTMEYPGRLLAPMVVRTITPAAIQKLLAAADEAGLFATPTPDYSAEMNVADAPNTVVVINAGGSSYTHSAYALGFGIDAQGNSVPEASPARAALHGYALLLGDLSVAVGAAELGPESIVEPSEYRLQAMATPEADLAGIDPAPTIVEWPASTGVDLATAAECARLSATAAGSVFADANSNTFFRQGESLFRISVAGVLPGDPSC